MELTVVGSRLISKDGARRKLLMKRILLLSGCLLLSMILMSCVKKKDAEIPTNEGSRVQSSGQSMDKESQTVQNTVNAAFMQNMSDASIDEVISEENAIVSSEPSLVILPDRYPSYGISLNLPENWNYEIEHESDLILRIHPEGVEGSIIIEYPQFFGVCGTGLKEETIRLNGHEARQGFYDGSPEWSFIVYQDPSRVVILNDARDWFGAHSAEIETILQSIEFTYYETDPGTEKEMVIDTAVIDVDNDGIPEDWSMTFGPTSGLFTVVITASQDGNIKYKNTFNMIWGHKLFFDEKDGSPCIVRMILGDNGEERTEYLNMYVREGRIVLDGLDTDYEGYWGDAAWNYDLKNISECSPAELFERMMYSPAWSSNPGEYLRAHKSENEQLLAEKEETLQYIFSEFLKGNQTGLKGHLMRLVLDELAPESMLDIIADTGQQYFDAWYGFAEDLKGDHDDEWIRENHPAMWTLLEMVKNSIWKYEGE